MRVIVNSGSGEDITDLCRENSGDMLHRALDIQGAITAVNVLNVDDDLGFAFKLLFFHLSPKTAKRRAHAFAEKLRAGRHGA
jgi:hypothetical protein